MDDPVIALHLQGLGARSIGKELGMARSTVRGRLRAAAMRGELGTKPVLPGFEISRTSVELGPDGELRREWVGQKPERGGTFEVPAGHTVKGVSALVGPDGAELVKWVKTREGAADPLHAVDLIKQAFADYDGNHVPIAAPPFTAPDLLTLLPCNDWHIGLYTWHRETGVNWDLSIAENAIGNAVEDALSRSPASGQCVVLGGGDLLHADNSQNQTARSGNALDVDGRYPKVFMAATRLKVRTIDAALRRHQHVTVRVLPGNHDEHTSHAVAAFLSAWYRLEPRVTVDLDPSLFWWHRFGKVMLGATHGHTVKVEQMASIMAHRRAEDWGASRHRYIHGFHLHHSRKIATEGNGAVSEVHQAPIPQDAWHHASGFLSGRSVQIITYHAEHGEIARARVAMMDG